ncbi:ribosome biogenesis GTPase YlqF [Oceanicoccus sagamiensis]|uniref:Ribosome biogenesis GTPase A n=1 Tax=Oceanicoccus sagamiensis TaxID=716816 RepID=A0A1X9NHC4_9GAMM|nr:ribosome biogenesis GTPase YlqF [Oceanicoccus sagamiensis]ARN75802.1 ribosome biogenesis GTPase YlqF [Oceanicoccus sagamiensis]
MSIQWFPGHMNKARKQVEEILPQIHLIIEVLDARIPFSSENPMIAKLRGDKPCIKVLTKSDLADPALTKQWITYLDQKQGVKALALTTQQPEKTQSLIDLCRKILPERDKGHNDIHVMIMGIPNVGKSTLINTLAGKTIAKTGNEPAVTKGQQRINLRNGIMLFDTPGMLWPKVESEQGSYRLATTGAIKDTAMSYDDVAFFAADFLLKHYPELLKKRYQLDNLPDTELEFLEIIGKKRGCLRSGGKVDLEKISTILLHELRAGTLGRITLETPEQTERETVIVEQQIEARAAKKAARKKNRKKGGH